VGTLIRTAAGLGYEGVVLSRDCADPFGSKCVQASAGAICSLWIRRCGEYLGLLQQLAQQGYALLAADVQGSEQWPSLKPGGVIVALGSEGQGLSQDLLAMAHWRYRIPLDATRVESLNVAVAGAICMFQARSATA
jgi:TrmH family RNA methyltransferase